MEFTVNTKLDLSGFDEVKKACEKLSKPIEVGILNNPEEARIGELQHFGGTGVYQYGKYAGQEVDIPPRPFIAAPVERFGGEILEKSAKEHLDFTEKSAETTLNVAGDTMAKDIQYWMDNGSVYPPKNSPRTIETKGFDHPLIDKGNLRDSIEYEVIK